MGFKNKDLSVIAYANGFTLWQYKTDDDIAIVEETPTYFPKEIGKLMAVGDIIIITSNGMSNMRQVINLTQNTVTIGRLN